MNFILLLSGPVLFPSNCADIHDEDRGKVRGVYTIYVGPSKRRISVYCDMKTDGGGWTVSYTNISTHLKLESFVMKYVDT